MRAFRHRVRTPTFGMVGKEVRDTLGPFYQSRLYGLVSPAPVEVLRAYILDKLSRV